MRNGKKMVVALFAMLLCLGMTACGFSVGNAGGSDDYKELFPDRAATLGSTYKTSNVAYDYSLGEYGAMKVYVDTSEGHSFELDQTYGGFYIKDKDGKEVIHTYPLVKEEYEAYTANVSELRTINGRQFFYSLDSLNHHVYTYLADCGIDLGMIFETEEDPSVFSLVAFRGTPIAGASSDPYAYKGQATEGLDEYVDVDTEDINVDEELTTDEENATLEDDAAQGSDATGSLTNSTLSPDLEKALNSLDTDYNSINWGVRYSLDAELPNLVVSITPYMEYDQIHLLLAFTNLYDRDLAITGTAKALSQEGEEIGETFLYTNAIGSGNTVLADINCGDKMPDGRVRWQDIKVDTEPMKAYVPWEADWGVSGNPADSMITVNYTIYSANKEAMTPGEVYFLLLDESGNVLVKEMEYLSDEIPAGEQYSGSDDIYGDPDTLAAAKALAMFVASN